MIGNSTQAMWGTISGDGAGGGGRKEESEGCSVLRRDTTEGVKDKTVLFKVPLWIRKFLLLYR